MKRYLLSGIFGAVLCLSSLHAQDVIVKTRPPAVRVERRGVRPGPNYVWVGGYNRWNGRSYIWEPGRWAVPPRAHAVWVAPRWTHRPNGWVFVGGRWR